MKYILLLIGILVFVLPSAAQKERKLIREGNGLYDKQEFEKAEVEYRKAIDKKAESYEAAFNLGDALYKQKKYDEALRQFSALAEQEKDKERLGELYHNIGNTLLSMQKTGESIEAYKESLRNRPASEETKYNLEFARRKQQQEQQDKDNKDKDNQDNKNNKDNKDNQDNKENKDNQDNKDQQNQDQKDQDKQNQEQNKDKQDRNKDRQDKNQQDRQEQPQQQPGKISKEDAQRLLEVLQNDEKKVQEKVRKEKVQQQKAKKLKIEKDW